MLSERSTSHVRNKPMKTQKTCDLSMKIFEWFQIMTAEEVAETKSHETAEISEKTTPPTDATAPQADQNNVSKKIADLEAQVNEWRDKCFRAVAELDNTRKRFAKEKEDVRFHTTQIICLHIIELFDSFKMGLDSAEKQKTDPKVLEGFQMIFRQFQAQLKLLKIEELNPLNEVFDPHFHDAVSHAYSDTVPEDHVLQVVRCGYKCGDRLLRAASVIISKGKAPQAETNAS